MGGAPGGDASLAGRDGELAELEAALEEALLGRGSACFVTGEPGMGKTRLVSELAERAAARGAWVLWGRAWEGEGAPALWPWRQILRTYARSRDPDTLLRELGGGARHIARLVPEVTEAVGATGEPPEPEAGRFQLFAAVAAALHAIASSRPLLLLLEDLHFSDPATLSLTAFAADGMRDQAGLLVATFREADLAARPELEGAIAGALPRGRRLALSGLDADAVARILGDLGVPSEPALVAAMIEATGGNPLFVHEYAQLLRTTGGAWPRVFATLPPGIGSAIRRRLSGLSRETRELLETAAVIGRDFSLPVLAAAAGLDAECAAHRLDEAARWRIVQGAGPLLGSYAFSHALVRHTLYDGIGSVRKAELHARAGEALECHYRDPGRHASELAHHFTAASGVSGPEKALAYQIQAAEQSLHHFAFEAAASHHRAALRLLGPDGAEETRARILIALGGALWCTGDTAGSSSALTEAGELARRIGSVRLMAEAALAHGGGYSLEVGNMHDVMRLMEAALERLAADDPIRTRLLARLGQSYTVYGFAPDRIERGKAYTAEAVAQAERRGDPALLANVLYMRGFALGDSLHGEERLAVTERFVEVAERSGRLEDRTRARRFHTFDLLRAGRLGEARRRHEATRHLAPQLGAFFYVAMDAMVPVVLALLQGDARKVRSALERARAASEATDSWLVALQLRITSAEVALALGDAAAIEALASSFQKGPTLQGQGMRARLLLRLGRPKEARGLFERLFEARVSSRGAFWSGYLLGMLAETCAELGDRERAPGLYAELRPYAGHLLTGSWPPYPLLGDAALFLGSLAALLGKGRQAEAHLARALRRHRAIGSPPLAARTGFARARALLTRGREGDAARAHELWKEALGIAQTAGMPGLVPELQPFGARAGAPPARRAVAMPSRGVFRREGDVWAVELDGRAARLRDAKGLRYLHHLLGAPGVEVHVLDLVGLLENPRDSHARDRAALTQAGLRAERGHTEPLLDDAAKAAYRRRLAELRGELDEATAFADAGRVARARAEIEAISAELSRALGLGGRDRRAASAAEHARVNATRTIHAAIAKIAREVPPLGHHLRRTVRTGVFCSYSPDPESAPDWRL
jgi:tetratricopeptide (TPR) repeat protein